MNFSLPKGDWKVFTNEGKELSPRCAFVGSDRINSFQLVIYPVLILWRHSPNFEMLRRNENDAHPALNCHYGMGQTFNRKTKCPKEEPHWLLFTDDLQFAPAPPYFGFLSCKPSTFLGIMLLLPTFPSMPLSCGAQWWDALPFTIHSRHGGEGSAAKLLSHPHPLWQNKVILSGVRIRH